MIRRFFCFLLLILSVTLLYSQAKIEIYSGIINDNAVRIREVPSLEGIIIGHLNCGVAVTVLGRSQNRMYLNGYDSFWLKIRKEKDEGWIYGAYVNLKNVQYDSLRVLSNDSTGMIDLNYSRGLPVHEFIQKEKESLTLQSARFSTQGLTEYYNAIVNTFNKQQSLRPFFLNTNEIGITRTSRFFYLSSSILSDFIQASYVDNISISPLNIHNEKSATFIISGFNKQAIFSGIKITTIAINIKRITNNNFVPLNGKTIIDWIVLTPETPEDDFRGDRDKFFSFMTSMPIYLQNSSILQNILN